MKWIGQHIWDFISRFRTTVYLENLETSSEENVLVVDSDGKVTKNTTLGGSDLTLTNEGDNRVITSTGGTSINAEANITYNADGLYLKSALSSYPVLQLLNSNSDDTAPDFQFQKTALGADDDHLGQIRFIGDDVKYIDRGEETSPPFKDIDLKNGAKMREDWFPVVWSN